MDIVKTTKSFVNKHGSKACVFCVFVGIGITIYETWNARPKVDKIMDEYNKAVNDIKADSTKTEEEVKKAVNGEKVEMVKKVSIAVVPVVVAGAATGGAAVVGDILNAKKIASMAATIEMGDVAYRKLENKLTDILGEEKAEEVKKEVDEDDAREAINKALNADNELSIIEQGLGGTQVYYDPFYERLFRSDDHTIIETCLKLNNRIGNKPFDEPYIEYSEFYDAMALSIPEASRYFIFDMNHPLKPNLNNTIKYGEISCTILEWYDKPRVSKVC